MAIWIGRIMNYRRRINEDIIRDFSKLFKIIFLVGARQVVFGGPGGPEARRR